MLAKSRYSDQELKEFKNIIEKKLANASEDLAYAREQITELAENKEAEGDWMDSNANNMEMEMLHTMANRQQHHIRDLENALIRIRNKSYGICMVSGQLIDKRRLKAVPTTTKSLAAKNSIPPPKEKKEVKPGPSKSQPEIITRVIRKKTTPTPAVPLSDEEDDEFFHETYMDDLEFDDTEQGGVNISDD